MTIYSKKPALTESTMNLLCDQVRIAIENTGDIVRARHICRALALDAGFSLIQTTLIVSAISELTGNIILHANSGEILLGRVSNETQSGITIVASDKGPGITNLRHVLSGDNSSTSNAGLGLRAVRFLANEFDIVSQLGAGTTVFTTIWVS